MLTFYEKSRLSLSKQQKILLSLATATVLLSGCGGGSSTTATAKSAYLIDSAVQGVEYSCGTATGVTDSDGKFTYDTAKCSSVEFKLGSLSLGAINTSSINADTYLTIQDLAGTTRNDIANENVIKMAVLLQSLDSDDNPNNGILITNAIKDAITLDGNLSAKSLDDINMAIASCHKTPVSKYAALSHLLEFTKLKDSTISASIPSDILEGTLITVDQLMWQDDLHTGNDYSVGLNTTQTSMLWSDANNYCSNLTIGSYSDWRLPTLVELRTIVDTNRVGTLKIKEEFQYVSDIATYWTSDNTSSPYQALGFTTLLGYAPATMSTTIADGNGGASVRCVRPVGTFPTFVDGFNSSWLEGKTLYDVYQNKLGDNSWSVNQVTTMKFANGKINIAEGISTNFVLSYNYSIIDGGLIKYNDNVNYFNDPGFSAVDRYIHFNSFNNDFMEVCYGSDFAGVSACTAGVQNHEVFFLDSDKATAAFENNSFFGYIPVD